MAHNAPLPQPDGAPIPAGPINSQANPRSRIPRGPLGTGGALTTGSSNIVVTPSPFLKLAAAYPMHTVPQSPNLFIPDTQMLYHVLGLCDQLMVNTESFTSSCPAWIPIVSQLYISVLWNAHVIRAYAKSGHGFLMSTLFTALRLDDCLIPGPLVPFFQAIAATKGPFDWSGDTCPFFPPFNDLWNENENCFDECYVRQIPFPALILDQLARFSASVPEPGTLSNYSNFNWYDNVFGADFPDSPRSHSLGPQTCGSLHVTRQQHDAARIFWANALSDFVRLNFAKGYVPRLHHLHQLFGLQAQNGSPQFGWFLQVSLAMQTYCRYFSGSFTFRSVFSEGIRAVSVYGHPVPNDATSAWLYPADENIFAFPSSRFHPLRPIPDDLKVVFKHADHEIGKQAEDYAMVAHTNIIWTPIGKSPDSYLKKIDRGRTHTGQYWTMPHHRISPKVTIAHQFNRIISSRYHQQDDDWTD